jgi:cytochrome c peroxidase
MKRMKRGYRPTVEVVVALVVACFVGAALGSSGSDDGVGKQAKQLFGPLPETMASSKNPITPEKTKLGKMLLYETRISVDGTVSCTKCHPISLYGADGLKKAIGDQCKVNPRNAPTIFNAASQIAAHWIGNRADVEDQARQSVIGPPAFGMPSYQVVEKRLKELGYGPLFRQAFPGERDPVTMDNFAKAIGAFERTLVTPAPFDAFLKGEQDALDQKAQLGLKTFMDVGCAGCHNSPYLGGQMYQKFGITAPYWQYTKSEEKDDGRYAVTKNEADRYVFKVPVLRNVAKTAPYFHDGSVGSLDEAIWIMGKVQLGKELTKKQVKEIDAFLNSLTGKISQDALTVPLLP